MGSTKIISISIIIILQALFVSCSSLENINSPRDNVERDSSEQEQSGSGFGAIIFCEDVTEEGVIIGASNIANLY